MVRLSFRHKKAQKAQNDFLSFCAFYG